MHPAQRLGSVSLRLLPLVLAAASAAQGTPRRVKDINLTTASGALGLASNPSEALTVGTTTFLVAADPMHGTELWRTDSWGIVTELVKDIAPGTASSGPNQLVSLNGLLFFTADDGVHGRELWRSDGTAAGTFLVSDIHPGSGGSVPSNVIWIESFNGTLARVYFSADDGVLGRELWYTTGVGAAIAVDANPGSASGMTAAAPIAWRADPTLSFASVYFAATNGVAGEELWQLGNNGARMCVEIRPGAGSSAPREFHALGTGVTGLVVFSAIDDAHGRELWGVRSSGSGADATMLLGDLNPGSASSDPRDIHRWSPTQYGLSAVHPTLGREFWTGPDSGGVPTLFMDINPGSADSSPVIVSGLVGSYRYVVATSATYGRELWRGTATTIAPYSDINPGTASSSPGPMWGGGTYNWVLFAATSPTRGRELWVLDTFSGLQPADEINPGPASSNPVFLAKTYPLELPLVAADDGVHGTEPWLVGPNSVTLVKDINAPLTHSHPREFAALGDLSTILFQCDEGVNGAELWRSDGTSPGTVLVKDIHPGAVGSNPRTLTAWNGKVWFVADDGQSGAELWSSDGTTAGTVLVKDIEPGPGGAIGQELVPFDGHLWFAASDGPGGSQLWRTDGTTAGTVLVRTINPAGSALPKGFAVVDDRLMFFSAFTATQGVELWRTNGSTAGTALVRDINAGSSGSTLSIFGHAKAAFGTRLVFAANDGVRGDELWQTDGTAAGTTMVLDINPGTADSSPYELTVVGGTLYFAATNAATGRELWRTNLLAGGTALVREIQLGSPGGAPRSLTALGGVLLFSAGTIGSGRELWRSDGTSAGTVLVKNIYAGAQDGVFDTHGPASPAQPFFTVPGGQRALFVASDGDRGAEVWRTDGTAAGTLPHTDFAAGAPGSQSDSYPARFALAGSRIFFAANDGELGYELYSMLAMASFGKFGGGCPGTGNLVPQLNGAGTPALGSSTFTVVSGNGLANSAALLQLGFGPLDLPVGNGCRALFDVLGPFFTVGAATNARGDASYRLPIPSDRSLEGLQLFFQCMVVDPQGAFLQTLAFSDGLRAVVGDG